MFSLSKFIVTLFYTGYIKYAPGTIGSIISFFFIFIIKYYSNKIIFFLIFPTLFILSIIMINTYTKITKNHDASEIIIDEFLGIFIIFFIYDYISNMNTYLFLLLSLILFRFFDIVKPFPIKLIHKKIKNSFGVIFDDLLAGTYTIICLLLINVFI